MSRVATVGPPAGALTDGRLTLPWQAEPLARAGALAGAHALLLHGPAGGGHLEFALLLAQGVLCEAKERIDRYRPCGHCSACHLVGQRLHPDLRLVMPSATRAERGWTEDDDYIAPKGEGKPSREIRVEQVRMAIDWVQQTSGRGRGKVLVLHPADALNSVAANALLKTLEEPPGTARLLLTSADPERLLPTVRSRCQRLRLDLPTPEVAADWLRAQGLAEPDALLAVAGGSPLEALACAQEGLTAALCAELPRRVAAGDPSPLVGRPIPRVVDLLLKLSHDAQVHAAGGAPRFFPEAVWPLGADAARLRAWQRVLLRAARHDEHPWNAGLLVEALVSQAAAAWPLPATNSRPALGGAPLHSRR